jgi:preprotein translocase subunit SecD
MNCDVNMRLNFATDVLARRAVAAGDHDIVVRKGSVARTVVVEAPGAINGVEAAGSAYPQELVPLLTSRGQLFFIDTGDEGLQVGDDVSDSVCETRCALGRYTVIFRGQDLDQSQIHLIYDKQSVLPLVTLAFKGDAQKRFADYTAANIGNYLTITLDGKVIESAVFQSQITDLFNIRLPTPEATALIAQLESGELPLMMTLVNVEQVTPTATK